MKKVYIYRRFERFWHWTQTLLILTLAVTGFEIHGSYHLIGFKKAVLVHDNAAFMYMGLMILIFFWLFITGEWRMYMPTKKHIYDQIEYYLHGIFHGAEHPTKKTMFHKFNPLQQGTYFALDFIILPVMVISGALYIFFSDFLQFHNGYAIEPIAYIHVAGAFLLIGFVIAHVYLTTTGYRPLSAIKAMISGWEEMSDEEAEVAVRENIRMLMRFSKRKIMDAEGKEDDELFEESLSEEIDDSKAMMIDFQKKLLSSNVGYFKINKEGKYVEVNDVWRKLYSTTNIKDPIGMDYRLDRKGEDLKAVESAFKQGIKGKTITGSMVARYNTDGTKSYHTISMSPYYENGEIAGVEGYIIDLEK
jgi:thiosulfate reductase cytochrome b subunit